LRDLLLQLKHDLLPAFLFFFVDLLVLYFWDIQLQKWFLLWFLIELLISFEEVMLLEIPGLVLIELLFVEFRCFNKNILYSLLTQDNVLLSDDLDPTSRSCSSCQLFCKNFLRQGWIFLEHNLKVLFLFLLDLLASLLS
jgi:hypothetical protein